MIRPAVLDDANELAELEAQLFDNSMSPALLSRELMVGMGFVFGQPAEPAQGYALARRERGIIDLIRLGVRPECQGKKVGEALLLKVIDLGYPVLLTVRKDNYKALRLYRKHRFEIVGHLISSSAWVLLHRGPEPEVSECPET